MAALQCVDKALVEAVCGIAIFTRDPTYLPTDRHAGYADAIKFLFLVSYSIAILNYICTYCNPPRVNVEHRQKRTLETRFCHKGAIRERMCLEYETRKIVAECGACGTG